jgi:hypothetical protein
MMIDIDESGEDIDRGNITFMPNQQSQRLVSDKIAQDYIKKLEFHARIQSAKPLMSPKNAILSRFTRNMSSKQM